MPPHLLFSDEQCTFQGLLELACKPTRGKIANLCGGLGRRASAGKTTIFLRPQQKPAREGDSAAEGWDMRAGKQQLLDPWGPCTCLSMVLFCSKSCFLFFFSSSNCSLVGSDINPSNFSCRIVTNNFTLRSFIWGRVGWA